MLFRRALDLAQERVWATIAGARSGISADQVRTHEALTDHKLSRLAPYQARESGLNVEERLRFLIFGAQGENVRGRLIIMNALAFCGETGSDRLVVTG